MKNVAIRVIKALLIFINWIIPKKKTYIFLRSYFPYPDNVQAVLEELILQKINSKYKIFCAGRGFSKYLGVKNVIFLKRNYIRELWFYFRSKIVIWDSSIYFNLKAIKRQISINLWHGTSFKKIGFYENKEKPYRMSTYATSYSKSFAEKISKAFGIPEKNVLICGEPRNDYLKHKMPLDAIFNIEISNYKKVVIWMPTFRESKNHPVINGKQYQFGFPFLNEESLIELDSFCQRKQIAMILKWHGSQIIHTPIGIKNFKNLFFLTTDSLVDKQISLYNIVSNCDALITDYSSIFVNFMILDRPIAFAYDDLDEYISNRGFMFDDVEQIMPGYRCTSFKGLICFLEEISDGIDSKSYLRYKFADFYNEFHDFSNSERLIAFLKKEKYLNV